MHTNQSAAKFYSTWILIRQGVRRLTMVFGGIFVGLVLVEMALRFGSYIFIGAQEYRNKRSLGAEQTAYKILALGESTTALGGTMSWPSQLEQRLNDTMKGTHFVVINKGVPGITSSGIRANLEQNLNTYSPNIVVAMMGVNDDGRDLQDTGQAASGNITGLGMELKDLRIYKLIVFARNQILIKMAQENWIDIHKVQQMTGEKGISDVVLKRVKQLTPRDDWDFVEQGLFWIDQKNYTEAESIFKKAIDTNLNNYWAYVELANLYRNQQRYSEAEMYYRKAIAVNPTKSDAYIELGDVYRNEKKYDDSDQVVNKAIHADPNNYLALIELSNLYRDQGLMEKAADALVQAKTLHPNLTSQDTTLGIMYRHTGRYKEKENILLDSIAEDPTNSVSYVILGKFYQDGGNYEKAIEIFNKVLALPARDSSNIYTQLGLIYQQVGRPADAIDVFQKAISYHPLNTLPYTNLAKIYAKQGKQSEARAVLDNSLLINPMLKDNYRAIRDTIVRRGIPFVAVQYPLRSVEILKVILGSEGVLFVDNEGSFEDAVRTEGYEKYFTDHFAGDFGHATVRGNELLARNIASVILPLLREVH